MGLPAGSSRIDARAVATRTGARYATAGASRIHRSFGGTGSGAAGEIGPEPDAEAAPIETMVEALREAVYESPPAA